MVVNNILIIYPVTPDSYWKFSGVFPYLGISSSHGALPPVTISALVPKRFAVRVIDMNTETLDNADLMWADALFITGMDVHDRAIGDLVALGNAFGKVTVVGGPFATVTPDAPQLAAATSVFIGELIDLEARDRLFADLAAGTVQRRYVAKRNPPMANSPIPDFWRWKFKKFSDAAIQVGCGCPYQCHFCQVWPYYGPPRYKDPAQVVAELQALVAAGFTGCVFIVDDNFIGNLPAARGIVQAINAWQKAHGFPLRFYFQADFRLAEEEKLARLMHDAGFYAVFIGIESPSQTALACMGKKQNAKVDAPAAVRKLWSYGLEVHCGLMLGNKTDTPASFPRMERFVHELATPRAMTGVCVAMHGTKLHEQLERTGHLLPEVLGEPFRCSNIRLDHLSPAELLEGYREVISAIYHPVMYFERLLKQLAACDPIRPLPVRWRDLRAAGLSVVRQGIMGSYRGEYWRFLSEVVKNDLAKLPRAIAGAVVFDHLHGFTQKLCAELAAKHAHLKEEENHEPAARVG